MLDCVFYFFVQGIDTFVTDLNTLHPILTECRVFKSELELALIQFANDISSEAHVQVDSFQIDKDIRFHYRSP